MRRPPNNLDGVYTLDDIGYHDMYAYIRHIFLQTLKDSIDDDGVSCDMADIFLDELLLIQEAIEKDSQLFKL